MVQQWPLRRSRRSLCWIFLTRSRCPTTIRKAKRRYWKEGSCGVSKIKVRNKIVYQLTNRDIYFIFELNNILDSRIFFFHSSYIGTSFQLRTITHAEPTQRLQYMLYVFILESLNCFINMFLARSCLQVTLEKGFTFSIFRLSAKKRG